MKSSTKSYLYAGLAILAWSTVSTAFKLSLSALTPAGLLLIASFTASGILGFYALLSKSGGGSGFISNLKKSLLPALLNPFLYYLVLFEAYHRLRAQEAQALNYTWAIVLAIFCIVVFKESFRVKDLAALFFSFFGVLIISTRGAFWLLHFDDLPGTLLAAGSSFLWALYWVINLKDLRPAATKLSFNFLLGSLFILLFVLVCKKPLFVEETNNLKAILGGLYVGFFEMGLSFLWWMKALEYSKETAKIANLVFITPFISLLFIHFVLAEAIHAATFVGLILIVASNLWQKVR